MAPEQIEHPQDVDQRADIYSLGVVFYEMLTGELPIGRFAPPSAKSAADPRVDQVVLRALEKERERRTQSAEEVKTQVEAIAATPELRRGQREEAQTEAAKSHQPWWTWSFMNSQEVDEICAHLTKAEKYPMMALHLIAAAWYLLAIFGIPAWIQSSSGSERWIGGLVLAIVFLVSLPMLDRLWQHFYCATIWAKARGLTPEQLRLYSFSGKLRFAVFALLMALLVALNLARTNGPDNRPQQDSLRERQQNGAAKSRVPTQAQPGKTVVLTGATNELLNATNNLRVVRVYTDSTLLPGETLVAQITLPDGRTVRAASSPQAQSDIVRA